ncbi:Calcineurin B-like protein 1 [Hondaea fermentalgiana]|uniref:Calcineurin B-like protein 1 n=1 Tax=Hondaea fermentalgiana TaxID=2315210 RepID=A0A2R5GNZ8_9STRA|nr:Calcineurin B-like protein 1 [Hondaea fermentalgiana]|eukprot:GBG32019.1 Calcineurin B-like protein 1 [Hondaea fermentalgiana]
MGQRGSSMGTLKRRQLKELQVQTHFDSEEILALYSHFKSIASSQTDDGQIDRNEFREAIGLTDSLFVDRLFSLFDENDDGYINFQEFICGLSILCVRGTLDEKTHFSFRIYDFDNDNKISNEELTSMLKTSLGENGVVLTPTQLELIIRATFEEADVNRDGFIDFEEYKALVAKQPSILSNMTLDFARVIEQRLETARATASGSNRRSRGSTAQTTEVK